MLIDSVELRITSGKGGNGIVHFLRNGQTAKGGPDGGDGGNGGSVYAIGSTHLVDLREFRFRKRIEAQNGEDGMRQKMHGKNGSDVTVEFPVGITLTDQLTGETFEITDTGKPILLAKGGYGGRGNVWFASATNRTPKESERGQPAVERKLLANLRLIADAGLIGLPNAGKSSLLSVLTNAKPKIGDYPFTTLEPNLGMLASHPLADIPGLIKGASKGKGLGIQFLSHIEKTKILLHCIDSTDPKLISSYRTIRNELRAFSPLLNEKPEYIVLTKTDLVTPSELKTIRGKFKKLGLTVFSCSIYDTDQIEKMKQNIISLCTDPTP